MLQQIEDSLHFDADLDPDPNPSFKAGAGQKIVYSYGTYSHKFFKYVIEMHTLKSRQEPLLSAT